MSFEDILVATIVPKLREAVRAEVKAALLEVKPQTGEYLSVVDAARIADVDPKTIRAWIKAKKLAGHHAGREHRVQREDLERFLSAPRAGDAEASAPGAAAAAVLAKLRKG